MSFLLFLFSMVIKPLKCDFQNYDRQIQSTVNGVSTVNSVFPFFKSQAKIDLIDAGEYFTLLILRYVILLS